MSDTETPIVIGAAGVPLLAVGLLLPQAARLSAPNETIPVTAKDTGFRMLVPRSRHGELSADEQTIALA
ncbi:MAG TPA: hypothetical protein VND54_13865 [Candidatus Saccharimonadales bacterium]|nr:hypothetical protein [Candidatus Saccharimonadales bacterium]